MDKKIAKTFLLDVKEVMDKHNINMFLVGGVLLGAVREGDFIGDDNDVDLGVKTRFWENKELLHKVYSSLKGKNIKIEYIYNNDIIRLAQNRNPKFSLVLIYMRKGNDYYYKYSSQGKGTYPLECIDTLDEIDFLGETFKVPHNPKKFLEHVYGKTWNIPISKEKCKYYNFTPLNWIGKENNKIRINTVIPLYYDKD